jgi:hypothetical protein
MHEIGRCRLNIAPNGFEANFDMTMFTNIENTAGNGVLKIMYGTEYEQQQQQHGDGNSDKIVKHSCLTLTGCIHDAVRAELIIIHINKPLLVKVL